MSQVQVVSNAQAWNSSALGCGPVETVVSRVSSSSSSSTSKLRHRSRVHENNNNNNSGSSNKEKEVQPTTDERALRDESKAARRLLQKKQDAIMTLAQERFGTEAQAKQEVLHAYAKLAVKWFQKTTEGQTFDDKKVEKQIQQTLEVFSNFLKEWRMDYLLLPGTALASSSLSFFFFALVAFVLLSLSLFRVRCSGDEVANVLLLFFLQPSSTSSVTSRCWARSRTSTCSTCSSRQWCSRSSSGTTR